MAPEQNTGNMESDTSRSEQVVRDFKKRKLSISALHKIQATIQGFENARATDARIAWIGVVTILTILVFAAYFFLGTNSTTIS